MRNEFGSEHLTFKDIVDTNIGLPLRIKTQMIITRSEDGYSAVTLPVGGLFVCLDRAKVTYDRDTGVMRARAPILTQDGQVGVLGWSGCL